MNEHSQVTGIFQCLAHSICFNPHPEKKRARITKKTLKGPPMTRWHSTLHVRMIFLTNLSIQLASERFQHLASKWLNHPSTVWWATHDTLSWRDVTKSNRPKLTRGALCDIFSCDYSAFFLICSNIWSAWRTLDGRAQPRRVWRRKTSRVKSINKIRFSSFSSARRLKDFPVGNRG